MLFFIEELIKDIRNIDGKDVERGEANNQRNFHSRISSEVDPWDRRPLSENVMALWLFPRSDITRGLNARRFVSENDVGRFAARWTIEVMHGVVPFHDRATSRETILPVVERVVDATSEVPGRQGSPQGLDLVDITHAQPPIPLQIPTGQRVLVSFQKVAHADASLPQQGLAGREHGSRQNVRPVKVTDAVASIALQRRPRQNVRPVKVADAVATFALQRRPRYNIRPVKVTDAHAAVPLQRRPRQDVHPVELTDTHATVPLQRRPRQDVHPIELINAGSTIALQQPRRLDGSEGPQSVPIALLLVRALRMHQRLQIERALGASRCFLAGQQQRRARPHEHAVLSQPSDRSTRRDAAHRMLQTMDIELRVAPMLRTKSRSNPDSRSYDIRCLYSQRVIFREG